MKDEEVYKRMGDMDDLRCGRVFSSSQSSCWEYEIPCGTSTLCGTVEAPNELAARVLIFGKHPEAQSLNALKRIPNV